MGRIGFPLLLAGRLPARVATVALAIGAPSERVSIDVRGPAAGEYQRCR